MSTDPQQPNQPQQPQQPAAQNGFAPNGYAQPQQGGYVPPQQGGYVAPQQGYAPPQQGYVAPQQGYAPQQYPPGWAPQGQQMSPPYGYHPAGFSPRHKLPGAALAASIIWIIYGSLQLLGVIAGLGMSGGRALGPGTIIGLGIGVAFLIAGIQTSTGKARGLLANGIVSIVLGSLIAIALLMLGSLFRGFGGGGGSGIIVLIGLLFGGTLITAGILACVGNKNYKEFHHTKFGGF